MTPDTKRGASFGAASTTLELAEALKHINRAITSPRENGTLLAAAERLLTLERELAEARAMLKALGVKRDWAPESPSRGTEGWKLVPEWATEEMMQAPVQGLLGPNFFGRVYREMLAAAPQPPSQGSGQDAARWRHARKFLAIEDIEAWAGVEWRGHQPQECESARADEAIDAQLAVPQQESEPPARWPSVCPHVAEGCGCGPDYCQAKATSPPGRDVDPDDNDPAHGCEPLRERTDSNG